MPHSVHRLLLSGNVNAADFARSRQWNGPRVRLLPSQAKPAQRIPLSFSSLRPLQMFSAYRRGPTSVPALPGSRPSILSSEQAQGCAFVVSVTQLAVGLPQRVYACQAPTAGNENRDDPGHFAVARIPKWSGTPAVSSKALAERRPRCRSRKARMPDLTRSRQRPRVRLAMVPIPSVYVIEITPT
jgi:hypothetical protein